MKNRSAAGTTCLLLSVKPRFANDILDGIKRFEFRRTCFRRRDVARVLLYATSPEKRVIGECTIETVLALAPDRLWSQTKEHAGIDRTYFDAYFEGRAEGYAIKVKDPQRYKVPLGLFEHFGLSHPPQSFCYVQGARSGLLDGAISIR